MAVWVSESLWGYPLMLAAHVTGLACVAGIFILADLGLLRAVRGIPPEAFRTAFKIGWYGLILNLASGFALFSSRATTFVESVPFLLKMSFILTGVMLTAWIHLRFVRPGESPQGNGGLRLAAAASLLCWISAIVAGRLIAYF